MQLNLYIFLFCLLFTHTVALLRCYTCSTVFDPRCGDHFALYSPDAQDCRGTCSWYRGRRGPGIVKEVELTRGCHSQRDDGCQSMEYNGIQVEACFCNRNYCNAAKPVTGSSLVILLGLFGALCIAL